MKMKKKLSENILDKFSIDFLRNQVLKNAYGNDDTVIARLDPRILLVWYLFFGLVPWFVNNLWFLMACFLLVLVTTVLARVAGLVLLLFAVGVFTQTGYLLVVSCSFRWGRFHHRPAADPDPEGRHLLSGLGHRVLRIGSGPSVQRADVVRLPGTALLFHFLRLSDPAHADGGVPEHPALLPDAGESAGARKVLGKSQVPVLSGQSGHARLLPADAQHRQALPDNGGGAGDQRLPLCGGQQGGEKDEACCFEGDL